MLNPQYVHGNQACLHGNRHRYHDKHGLNGNQDDDPGPQLWPEYAKYWKIIY